MVELTLDGDEYTMTTSTMLKTTTIKFKLGEEFEEERQDGTKVKSTITIDGMQFFFFFGGGLNFQGAISISLFRVFLKE